MERGSEQGGNHEQGGDYDRVAAAIRYIRDNRLEQPSLAEVAGAVHLSAYHLQRIFTRWAGISPKRFLQCLTLEHAKRQLSGQADLLSASHDAGLSGPGRLHDLFVTLEAVTPGQFKEQGRGLQIRYGKHPSPFGECIVGQTERGICFLEFMAGETEAEKLQHLARRWPEARLHPDSPATSRTIGSIFSAMPGEAPLHLLVRGTNFQVSVWRALLDIPPGRVTTYAEVARRVGRPNATRAVGSAVGANPVAWLIPCHRVLRSDGRLGGYHWGTVRKQACLAWEAARVT